MNIAAWCIRNNRTSFTALALLALTGVYTFLTIGRLEDPEFTIRTAVVQTAFPGASPQKVEELVTDRIEKKIQEMGEIDNIVSQSMTGQSLIFVQIKAQFKDSIQDSWTRLRNKVDDVKRDLPDGAIGPFVNDEFGDVFPIVIALTGEGYSYRELKDIADDTRDALLGIDSVAKVDLYGTQEERVFVEFSNARLAELGYSPEQLAQILNAQNVLQPGGEASVGPERVTIEATGEFKTIEDIRRVSLRIPGRAETLYLGDIAAISRDFVDPPSTLTRFNGRPCLMLALSMVPGDKVTEMGKAVTQRIDELRANLPIGLEYDVFVYQPRFVDRSISEFTSNLYQAFLFVVIVMLVFCGLRMGLIAGALVPMAMLLCIAAMPFFDIKLQSVSIASLIIALGMLVDNGIVTSENILVRLASGEDRLKACAGAVQELWLPLLAASLTTICAFLPIALGISDTAEYCLSLFQVVTITLLASWLLSITMTPMLCYYFLKPKSQKATYTGRFYQIYRGFLIGCLRHRFVFLVVTVLVLISAFWSFRFIPSVFFPPDAREMFLVDFWQPYGTDIRVTEERARRLETFLLGETNTVASVGVFVGEGGPRWMLSLNVEQQNPNYAFFIVTTRDREVLQEAIARTRLHLQENFPDCRFTVKQLETGAPVGAPIQIRISGRALDTLYTLRDRIFDAIDDVPGVLNIRDDWGEWVKKLEVEVNQEKAKQAGVTSYDVASSLRAQISGLQATELREGKEAIPIEIRSEGAYRDDLGSVESLNVYSYSAGVRIPLLQVARGALVWQPSNIRRRDKIRTMEVRTDVSGRFASAVLEDIRPRVLALTERPDWPSGYTVEFAGEDADSSEAMDSIMANVPLALGLLVLILIAQFNSIRRPAIIALTIPPMFIGIAYGLIVSSAPYGFMAFLGTISLMGIIVNNAIMMIDRIEIERGAGQTVADAIVVSAQRRFRPILMTAITTIVGLIPLTLNGGEMWRPMANTIIFGLGFSTLLTLLLCPVLYSLFFPTSFADYRWNPDVLKKSTE